MTELGDITNAILPMIVSAVIAVLILGLQRVTRSGDDTVAQAVRIESVDNSLRDIKVSFEKVEKSIRDIWNRVDEIGSIVKLNTWRLDKLETEPTDYHKKLSEQHNFFRDWMQRIEDEIDPKRHDRTRKGQPV